MLSKYKKRWRLSRHLRPLRSAILILKIDWSSFHNLIEKEAQINDYFWLHDRILKKLDQS